MTQPLVTIVTPTYNRPAMFAECAASVLAQTFTDWTWWVVFNAVQWPKGYAMDERQWNDSRIVPLWYPASEAERQSCHVPAKIVNWLYPKVTTPYIYFLADDDLIDPDGMARLVRAMNGGYEEDGYSPDWKPEDRYQAVYGRCEVQDQRPDGSYAHACWCYDDGDVGLGTSIDPHCRLDGGQVLHTKALWDRATADGWQLTDSKADAPANDGTLLRRLAEFARFHYVPQRIVTHRRHAGASFHKPQGV